MPTTSHSQTVLDGLVERCNQSLQRGMKGGVASLHAYRDAGATLRELKDLLPGSQFGPIAEMRCGCCKQWRARLMKLDKEWDAIQSALRWAEGCGRNLGRKAYSLDGAVALLNEWRRAEPLRPGPLPASKSQIRQALRQIYDELGDNPPNINRAWELIKQRLPNVTRARVREVLREDEFARRRRKPGQKGTPCENGTNRMTAIA